MLKNSREGDVPVNDPGFIFRGRGPNVLWFANGAGGGTGENGDGDGEEKEVQSATDALDAISGPVDPDAPEKLREGPIERIDKRLKGGESPKKVWSDVKEKMTERLKDDPRLQKDVEAVFDHGLGDELEKWHKMAEKGKPDRDPFLKADKTIADIISSYDYQLKNLQKMASGVHKDMIAGMREGLRAIARHMSRTTKDIDKDGKWKS